MSDILGIILDVISDGVSITGMVVILMMLIEFLNRGTQGRAFGRLSKSRWGQVLLGAGMGMIPGCALLQAVQERFLMSLQDMSRRRMKLQKRKSGSVQGNLQRKKNKVKQERKMQ